MENEIKFKDVAHLYAGVDCEIHEFDSVQRGTIKHVSAGWKEGDTPWPIMVSVNRGIFNSDHFFFYDHIKPILRPLLNMNEQEALELNCVFPFLDKIHNYEWSATDFVYMLSKHFDLFGLIESGQAIDLTTNLVK